MTLEDWNTWQYLFKNKIFLVEIDTSTPNNTDLYQVSNYSQQNRIVRLKFTPKYGIYVYYKYKQNGTLTTVATTSHTTLYIPVNVEKIYLCIMQDKNTYGEWSFIPENLSYLLFREDSLENKVFKLKKNCGESPNLYSLDSLGNIINTYPIQNEDGVDYVPLKVIESDYITSNTLTPFYYGFKLDKKYIYEPPLITIDEPFYYGCNNNVTDKFDSPVDFEAYINNKQYDVYNIPLDYEKDYLLVNVKSKSEYPYLPLDKQYQVPIEYKIAETIDELTLFDYVKLGGDLSGFELIFAGNQNVVDLDNHTLLNGIITNNKETTFKNGQLQSVTIINNDDLSLTNIDFKGAFNKIVNNGELTIDECLVNRLNIINNGTITINNSNLDLTATSIDLPFLHNTGDYHIINNDVKVTGAFNDNNIIFIRGMTTDDFKMNNDWEYDVEYTEDETTYHITGDGFTYSNIDEDTLILSGLVIEDV